MKKYLILTSILTLAGCGAYHTSKLGMVISNPDIQFTPQEAKIDIDSNNKITGSAECFSFLWVFNSAPERQAYGVPLQTNEGVIASSECVAGAIYDAMNKTDADVLVAPHYTTVRDGLFCFGSRCLFGNTKILVKGYPGKIKSIKDRESKK